MATVTGITSARADAIEAEIPVSGAFSVTNHLIVTKNDTSTEDFGAPLAATTALAGIVELATSADTIIGTATGTAVTPKGLADHAANIPGAKVQNITAVLETVAPSTYPTGISLMAVTSWSLNAGVGTVVTYNYGSSNCFQIFNAPLGSGSEAQAWMRSYSTTWSSWVPFDTLLALTATGYSESSAVSTYPVGSSRLYYTTSNSGAWSFTGKAGEVYTYNDGVAFARQTFTRQQGGTPNLVEQWIRTNDFVNGWTPWHKNEYQDAITVLVSASSAITTTAQTAVTGLAVPVEASATYLMEAWFIIASTVATADTMANSWTGPSGATMQWCDTNSTGDYQATLGAVAVGDTTLNNATHVSMFKGVLKTSTTAGNLTPTFGVSATTTSPSYTVGANSYVRLTRIA